MNKTGMARIRRTMDTRILLCFCVDSSVSMSKDELMETTNREIEKFLLEKKTRNDLDVCLVTFGNEAKVQCPFGSVQWAAKNNWTIKADETLSDLGAGVLKALECLKARKEEVARRRESSTSSLIIITSGDITDPSCCNNEAIPMVKALIRAGDFKVNVLVMDKVIGKNAEILRSFMVNGDQVKPIYGLGDIDICDVFSRGFSDESTQSIELGV